MHKDVPENRVHIKAWGSFAHRLSLKKATRRSKISLNIDYHKGEHELGHTRSVERNAAQGTELSDSSASGNYQLYSGADDSHGHFRKV